AGARLVEIRQPGHLSRLNQAAHGRVGQEAAAERRDDCQRLAPENEGIEGRIEHAEELQREEAVAARAQEVVLKSAARIHLIQIDAAPETASERADVARF